MNKGVSSFNYMKNLRGKVMYTMKMGWWGGGHAYPHFFLTLVLDEGE